MMTIVKFNFIIFFKLIKLKNRVNKINSSTTILFVDEFISLYQTFLCLYVFMYHLTPQTQTHILPSPCVPY